MCGRYALHAPHSEIAGRYRYQEDWVGDTAPRYNISPGTAITLLAVRDGDAGPADVLMAALWGFHPAWADNKAPSPINARAEKVATSPYFRNAFQHRRALVPANGWYEWRQDGAGGKQPYYITHADGELLMFAGLWEPAVDDRSTAAIITQPAGSDPGARPPPDANGAGPVVLAGLDGPFPHGARAHPRGHAPPTRGRPGRLPRNHARQSPGERRSRAARANVGEDLPARRLTPPVLLT